MSGQKKLAVEELVDMTAMVDIVFFVLIFFMFNSLDGKFASIQLPPPDTQKSESNSKATATEMQTDKDCVIVRVDRNSSVWINDSEVKSEQGILEKLRELQKTSPKMLILGHSEAKQGTIVMVLDAGTDVGIKDIQLTVDDDT
jgi:biopolymer transport protein ExbD